MRPVPDAMWDIWNSGLFVGDNRPITRAIIRRNAMHVTGNGMWRSLLFKQPSDWEEIPNIQSVTIDRRLSQDAASMDMSIVNQVVIDPLATSFNYIRFTGTNTEWMFRTTSFVATRPAKNSVEFMFRWVPDERPTASSHRVISSSNNDLFVDVDPGNVVRIQLPMNLDQNRSQLFTTALPNSARWVKVTVDLTTGEARVYWDKSSSVAGIDPEKVSWRFLEKKTNANFIGKVDPPSRIYVGSGSAGGNNWGGRLYRVLIRWSGRARLDFNPDATTAANINGHSDPHGNVWEANVGGAINIGAFYDSDVSLTSTTSASHTTKAALSTLSSGKDYLCIGMVDLGANTVVGGISHADVGLPDGTTAVLATNHESTDSVNSTLHRLGFMRKVAATTSNLDVDVWNTSGGANSTFARNSAVVAIELDNLVENTDYWYSAGSGNYTHTATATVPFSGSPSITWTPAAGEKYLILAMTTTAYNMTSDKEANASIVVTGQPGITVDATHRQEGERTDQLGSHIIQTVIHSATNASTTVEVKVWDDNLVGNESATTEATLFILRLNKFESFSTVYTQADYTLVEDKTYETAATVSHNPSSTGDHLVFGSSIQKAVRLNATSSSRQRLTFGGVEDPPAPLSGDFEFDPDDENSWVTPVLRSLSTGATAINLDVYGRDSGGANIAKFGHRTLAVFSVKTGGGTDQSSYWVFNTDTSQGYQFEKVDRFRRLLGSPGYYTYNRGTNRHRNVWGHEENDWKDLLLPNRVIYTYQGYGTTGATAPYDDSKLVLTGIWLIDTVEFTGDGLINIRCRDLAKLLVEQHIFPPVVPVEHYPLKIFGPIWEEVKVTTTAPDEVVQNISYQYSANYAKHVPPGPNGLNRDSSVAYVYNNYNRSLFGHRAEHAFDGLGGGSYWLSEGYSNNTLPEAFVWLEARAQGNELNQVRYRVRNFGNAHAPIVYVSIAEGGAWLGSKRIPYVANPATIRYNASSIPYVFKKRLEYTDKWQDLMLPSPDGTVRPYTYNATKLRLTFNDLQNTWQNGALPNFGSSDPYRIAVREFEARLRTRVVTNEIIPGDVTTSINLVPTEGNIIDYSELVKLFAGWGGFYRPQEKRYARFIRFDNTNGNYAEAAVTSGVTNSSSEGIVRVFHSNRDDPPNQNTMFSTENDARRFSLMTNGNLRLVINIDGTPETITSNQIFPNSALWARYKYNVAAGTCDFWASNNRTFTRSLVDWSPLGTQQTGLAVGVADSYTDAKIGAADNGTLATDGRIYYVGVWEDDVQVIDWDVYRQDSHDFTDSIGNVWEMEGDDWRFNVSTNKDGQFDTVKPDPLVQGWSGNTGRIWGDFEYSGAYPVDPVEIPTETWEGKTLMEGINIIRDILGFIFYVDSSGGVVWRHPNIWRTGNWITTQGFVSGFVPEVHEKNVLIDYGVTVDDQNLRSRILVASLPDEEIGIGYAEYKPGFAFGERKGAPLTDLEILAGQERVMTVGGFPFQNQQEMDKFAFLTSLWIHWTLRSSRFRIPAIPAFEPDDQIRIIEPTTSDSFVHYLQGVSSSMDLNSGTWYMDIDTHWLGEGPDTEWIVKRIDLDDSPVLKAWLVKIGILPYEGDTLPDNFFDWPDIPDGSTDFRIDEPHFPPTPPLVNPDGTPWDYPQITPPLGGGPPQSPPSGSPGSNYRGTARWAGEYWGKVCNVPLVTKEFLVPWLSTYDQSTFPVEDIPWNAKKNLNSDRVAEKLPAGPVRATLHRWAWPVFDKLAQLIIELEEDLVGGMPVVWASGHNCRVIKDSNTWSRHAWGIALDINGSYGNGWWIGSELSTESRALGNNALARIRLANPPRELADLQVLKWGGSWSIKDNMHFQVNVTPYEIERYGVKLI